jgi:hypothetical protein
LNEANPLSTTRNLTTGLVILLVIGIIYSGIGYFRERQQRQTLESRLDNVNQMLALIPAPQADLDQMLEAAQNANAEARQGLLPEKVDTIQIVKNVLKIADESRLDVIPLTTGKWADKKIEGENYRVLTINLSMEGSMSAVTNFISRLYSADFKALAIENIEISNTNEGKSNSEPVTGNIGLAVYTRGID